MYFDRCSKYALASPSSLIWRQLGFVRVFPGVWFGVRYSRQSRTPDWRPFLRSSGLVPPIYNIWAPNSVYMIVDNYVHRIPPLFDLDNGIDEDSYAGGRYESSSQPLAWQPDRWVSGAVMAPRL